MKKIRLAIVGCGFMSDIHKRAFDELKDKIEVIATVDVDLQKARSMAELLGASTASADYREVLGAADSALLALPHHLHHPIGIDCLHRGIHVLMEKPLALDERECLDLIRASKESGAKLMVGYIMRFHPQIRELKKIIDDGRYGECFQMSIWTEQYTYLPEGSWMRSAKKLGGGQLFSHGCHYVDLLFWMMGKPVRGAHLGTNLCTPWMEMEGTSNAIFEFEGGKLGYHFGTWGAKGTRHSYAVHAFFRDGMVECALNEGKMYLHRSTDPGNYAEKSDVEELIFACEPSSHLPKYELEYFADCVIEGVKPMPSGVEALKDQKAIWAMYGAERENRMADLREFAY
ncbi:MAG: Gfo/Idh/MocA family oxidoreductase [Clostridiales bacterium]|nr:Gfo/Idh/MocA family oxidoreductase [Clostridiales bacterium]